jgi:hypothetical protein
VGCKSRKIESSGRFVCLPHTHSTALTNTPTPGRFSLPLLSLLSLLHQVSSYDLINPGGRYSSRVRLLGSFHLQLASQTQTPDGQDIDDALYGNEGGQEEQVRAWSFIGEGEGFTFIAA